MPDPGGSKASALFTSAIDSAPIPDLARASGTAIGAMLSGSFK